MTSPPIDVPGLVRQRAMSNGIEGRRRLKDPPDLVGRLANTSTMPTTG